MNDSKKTLEFKFERTIPAPVDEVFNAWLNPEVPGTPWHENDKLLFNPKVDGFFYWLIRGNPHYGRFTEIHRPERIQHTWMSPSTLGMESMVTLTFEQKGAGTLMTLLHSGIPDNEGGRGHEKGWNYFLDNLASALASSSRKQK